MTSTVQESTSPRTSMRLRAAHEMRDALDSTGKIVIIDFLLGMCLVVFTFSVAGLPLATLAGTALALLSFFRKPKNSVPKITIFVFLIIFGLAWVIFDSAFLGISTNAEIARRVIRIMSVFLVALFIADGRIDFKSLILGVSFTAVINVPVYYLGLAPDYYPGYLTGWLADKNVSGLYYATIAVLLFSVLTKKSHRTLMLILFGIFVWQTGSRTSIAALLFAFLWILIARRFNILLKAVLAVLMVRAVEYLETNFAQAGAFSDRTGTDLLRGRIDAAAQAKINEAPWNGLGLGQAFVNIQERVFFFHNSFWTLIIEGGWIYLAFILAATIYAGFLMKQGNAKRNMYAEGAIVLLFICAWRLGEVFLTMPWGLAIGLALLLCAQPLEKKSPHIDAPYAHTSRGKGD